MEYQCNKLTVIPEVKSAHTEMRLRKKQMTSTQKILKQTEVHMSLVGDGEISTEQLTLCESTRAAMSAKICRDPGECQGRI